MSTPCSWVNALPFRSLTETWRQSVLTLFKWQDAWQPLALLARCTNIYKQKKKKEQEEEGSGFVEITPLSTFEGCSRADLCKQLPGERRGREGLSFSSNTNVYFKPKQVTIILNRFYFIFCRHKYVRDLLKASSKTGNGEKNNRGRCKHVSEITSSKLFQVGLALYIERMSCGCFWLRVSFGGTLDLQNMYRTLMKHFKQKGGGSRAAQHNYQQGPFFGGGNVF